MNNIIIHANEGKSRINRHIYGHFSEHLGRCIYGGYFVGEDAQQAASPIPNVRGIRKDVVAALKKIKIPNLRWPGGCFADEYHWKDGIGPKDKRPKMINTHWGGVTEDNSFGTHEFLDLCEQLSEPDRRCEPYICGNVGSGTVQELSQWVEYCNFDGVSPMAEERRKNGREKPWGVKFWGIGNENWGCGGNMTPEFYADNFLRYATYVRNYNASNCDSAETYKIAGGPNDFNYNWTKVLMEKIFKKNDSIMNALSLHYYTVPGDWAHKGYATEFNEAQWYTTMQKTYQMNELLQKHGAIMDEYDPKKKVSIIVDEWGTWFDVEPGTNPGFLFQQNSLRDALVAGINFNIFHNHCERVSMTNIAQTINVLQSVILTEGAKMVLTPTYHVFDMYKVHQDALKLPAYTECNNYGSAPIITASASEDCNGKLHVSITNIDIKNEQVIALDLRGSSVKFTGGSIVTAQNMNDYNSFDGQEKVTLKDFNAVKQNGTGGKFTVTMPPKSVVTLEFK